MLRSKLSLLREYLTPINPESNFATTGEISPDEFVIAGDYLTLKFPTWQWSSCPKGLQKSFLPPDKQFLVTKHVPLYNRATSAISAGGDDEEETDADGWVVNRAQTKPEEEIEEIAEVDEEIDDEEFDDLEMIDNNDKVRRYDLYITYLTSYRVPKMYLVGYNSNGIPLLPQQMFEDINADYKDKTATIEQLPVAQNTTSVSIHPCKHLNVMRVLMKHSKKEGEETGIRVDHYLVIFLKFIASVTPGIEYDYTMDAL